MFRGLGAEESKGVLSIAVGVAFQWLGACEDVRIMQSRDSAPQNLNPKPERIKSPEFPTCKL